MHKPLFRAALVASTVAAVLLPAAVASAQTIAIPDGAGDVWMTTHDQATGTEETAPAGTQPNADLVRTTVKHTSRKLVVIATYDELKRTGNRFYFMTNIRTNEGIKRELGVETLSKQGWGGTAYLGKPSGAEVRCSGLAHEIDYTADTVRVTVPRACLSKPRWVQLRSGAIAMDPSSPEFTYYLDNGHNATGNEPTTWSARVRRG